MLSSSCSVLSFCRLCVFVGFVGLRCCFFGGSVVVFCVGWFARVVFLFVVFVFALFVLFCCFVCCFHVVSCRSFAWCLLFHYVLHACSCVVVVSVYLVCAYVLFVPLCFLRFLMCFPVVARVVLLFVVSFVVALFYFCMLSMSVLIVMFCCC